MPSTIKIIASIFILTLLCMLALAFAVPRITGLPLRIAVFLGAGVILSSILSSLVSSFVKARAVAPAPPVPAAPPAEGKAFEERAVQMLSILQKNGRLIDFLEEDIAGYGDSQIGRAVRDIHKGCRETIGEHVRIEPVMKESEGTTVTVNQGFDPSAIRLTGNVVGAPPFRGTIRHSGWRAAATNLPPIPKSQDASIIEPAEVEIP
ncbi:MAG TPA: DUF2760 domain-containing protein [Dissulfurispiraceae bacterium]